ncbi:MAG: 50S ribosomal protein L17 [candidate division WS1 bacterium]|jgi:large subunit ribosomal protein L17|nr:50S ribosomal protein L17 [candidate division WS1 bacterium]
MRHRHSHRQLNRATDQRIALLRGLVSSLLRHNRIKTTAEKAKEASRLAERMISLAKRGDLTARRQVLREVHDPELVKHLFGEIAPRYRSREGGYTRVILAGQRRGDAAQMAILELTE